jgi:hypothetical protein
MNLSGPILDRALLLAVEMGYVDNERKEKNEERRKKKNSTILSQQLYAYLAYPPIRKKRRQ